MIPFLVVGEIHVTRYEGVRTKQDDSRIVMAESAEEAEQKYNRYWNQRTDEYAVYYSVYGCEARETIL